MIALTIDPTPIRRQWWSKHNPLSARGPPSTPAETGSETEGKDKEPKAPNATPEDSEADKREEDRFRDIIERWCYLAP